jgi:hypothetical protein
LAFGVIFFDAGAPAGRADFGADGLADDGFEVDGFEVDGFEVDGFEVDGFADDDLDDVRRDEAGLGFRGSAMHRLHARNAHDALMIRS